MHKGFKINCVTKKVELIEISDLKDMQNAVGGYIESALDFKENALYVNEEGLLDNSPILNGFKFEGGQDFYAGNGLFLGIDYATGESKDCTLIAEEIESKVSFRSLIRGIA